MVVFTLHVSAKGSTCCLGGRGRICNGLSRRQVAYPFHQQTELWRQCVGSQGPESTARLHDTHWILCSHFMASHPRIASRIQWWLAAIGPPPLIVVAAGASFKQVLIVKVHSPHWSLIIIPETCMSPYSPYTLHIRSPLRLPQRQLLHPHHFQVWRQQRPVSLRTWQV